MTISKNILLYLKAGYRKNTSPCQNSLLPTRRSQAGGGWSWDSHYQMPGNGRHFAGPRGSWDSGECWEFLDQNQHSKRKWGWGGASWLILSARHQGWARAAQGTPGSPMGCYLLQVSSFLLNGPKSESRGAWVSGRKGRMLR